MPLECDKANAEGFHGEIYADTLPGMDITSVRSSRQEVKRTPSTIASSADAWVLVSIQARGTGVISQDGRQTLLNPGDLAIYDSTRPYALGFDQDFEQIVLKFHKTALQPLVSGLDHLTARTIPGSQGIGQMMTGLVRQLDSDASQMPAPASAAISEAVKQLLVAGLYSLPGTQRVELPSLSVYHIQRVQQVIRQRLQDPGLTMEAIAYDAGISTGHLHRLFRDQPQTPAEYMWSLRLDACSRELIAPEFSHRTVADIAFRWGFNDAAHFSRAFRKRFLCTPREWRKQHSD